MDPKNYQNSSAGKPLRNSNGYWYFLPTNLPPDSYWSPMLISTLADAERNLAKLAGLGISPVKMNIDAQWAAPFPIENTAYILAENFPDGLICRSWCGIFPPTQLGETNPLN
jgi:hypothetical protein